MREAVEKTVWESVAATETLRRYAGELFDIRSGTAGTVYVCVSDRHHAGAAILWYLDRWWIVDYESRTLRIVDVLLLVTPPEDVDPEDGLNQAALACDLDSPEGVWVLDADNPQFKVPSTWRSERIPAVFPEPKGD